MGKKLLTKPEVIAAYRKAITGTTISGHACHYVRVINLCHVYLWSLHESAYLCFQISDGSTKTIHVNGVLNLHSAISHYKNNVFFMLPSAVQGNILDRVSAFSYANICCQEDTLWG